RQYRASAPRACRGAEQRRFCMARHGLGKRAKSALWRSRTCRGNRGIPGFALRRQMARPLRGEAPREAESPRMTVDAQIAPLVPTRIDVLAALHTASAKTGADFDYLLATAMRESKLDAQAQSKASSAAGLFQFVEQTWLGLVKRYGERHGLSNYANAIRETDTGRYSVASHTTKSAILALRKDPELSALMAGEAANETKQSLQCSLGRDICGGELYAAHFLGEGGARRLIALNEKNPHAA